MPPLRVDAGRSWSQLELKEHKTFKVFSALSVFVQYKKGLKMKADFQFSLTDMCVRRALKEKNGGSLKHVKKSQKSSKSVFYLCQN